MPGQQHVLQVRRRQRSVKQPLAELTTLFEQEASLDLGFDTFPDQAQAEGSSPVRSLHGNRHVVGIIGDVAMNDLSIFSNGWANDFR